MIRKMLFTALIVMMLIVLIKGSPQVDGPTIVTCTPGDTLVIYETTGVKQFVNEDEIKFFAFPNGDATFFNKQGESFYSASKWVFHNAVIHNKQPH